MGVIAALTSGRVTALRPWQESAIADILSRFIAGRRVVALNAPPGTGKSIIALFLTSAERAVVSTSTTVLQNQYGMFIPVLKGRKWYRCPLLLFGTAEDAPCAFGLQCDEGQCEWRAARRAATEANTVCLNHALLWSETAVSSPVLSARRLLVVDEAHNFAEDVFSACELRLGKGLFHFLTGFNSPVGDVVQWGKEVMPRLNDIVRAGSPNQSAAARRLMFVLRMPPAAEMRWEEAGGEIRIFPSRPEEMVRIIISRFPRVLMLSASITREFIWSECGITDFDFIEVPSQFPPSVRPILFRPVARMSRSFTDEDIAALTAEISRILEVSDSRAVVHTVSKNLTDVLAHSLQSRLDGRVIVAYGRSTAEALEKFFASPRAVLVSPSVAEGVDFAGDRARIQFIPKVPFPDLGDSRYASWSAERITAYAAARFVQMYGRLTRSENDRSVTFVLDSHFTRILPYLPAWVREAVRYL